MAQYQEPKWIEFTEPYLQQVPRLQLSIEDTAAALNLPVSTLEKECRAGRGPVFFTVGRRKYTTKTLIEEWQAFKIADAKKSRIAE